MQSDQNQALDILPRLRQATAALHRQVDSLAPLAHPQPALPDYLAQLQFNYVWLRDLQAALTLAGQLPAEWLAHNALCLQQLQQDLAAAGLVSAGEMEHVQHASPPMASEPVSHAALSPHVPAAQQVVTLPEGLGASWGVQYVIEGSFLGSSMLYQRLRPILPADCPMLFFSARHAGCAERWRHFKLAIEASLGSESMTRASRLAEAEQGAQAAFAHFLDILQVQPGQTQAQPTQAQPTKESNERQRYA